MQFATAPWQFTTNNGIPQVWAGLPSQTLLAAPNQIFIRGTQPDGTPGMFIQQSPQATTIQAQQNRKKNQQIIIMNNVMRFLN